jgi:GT2 family glycosyltransferase
MTESESMNVRESGPPIARPKVSVVLPTHDRPTLLAEAMQSVLSQSHANWELIVVDDASTPPVQPDVFRACADSFRLVTHPRPLGGAAAKNSGVAAAQGEIFAFLDDDDEFDPAYLDRAVGILSRHPRLDVVFMGVAWFGSEAKWGEDAYREAMDRTLADARGTALEPDLVVFNEELLGALLNRVPMAFQRPVVRRSAFERIGAYRTDCLLWDSEWALRAAMHGGCAVSLTPLYRQRSSGQGYSSKVDKRQAHAESALDMVLGLLHGDTGRDSEAQRTLLHSAAVRNADHLAYFHAQRGEVLPCISAWWLSQRLRPAPGNWKAPVSAVLRSMGWLERNR